METQSIISHAREAQRLHPSQKLCVIGITGTNGKTTVSHLIKQALNDAGFNAFALGTLNSGDANLTTPLAHDIETSMHNHLQEGGTHFILEVSSEGIVEGRIDAIDFDVKILTNITPDHLDYHKTFQEYERVKLDFMNEGEGYKVLPQEFLNLDIGFKSNLIGDYNQLNTNAAFLALRYLGIAEESIQRSLSAARLPKGRLESVDRGQPFWVFIDYAHTPDALESVVSALRKQTDKRLLVLFGCGGDRDTSKRPVMGAIATQFSDKIILTDDNPRFEDGNLIVQDILAGVPKDFSDCVVIRDRREAIRMIISEANAGDIVLIAGKGHEQYQVVNNNRLFFDDHEEAENALLLREES